jgi:hypothetical protein
MPSLKKKFVILLFLFVFLSLTVSAQFTEVGANEPPGLRWRKIDTLHFTIVFPERLTSEAQNMANRLESIFSILLKDAQRTPKRLTLVLSNQGVEENGYFRLAPRMAEFYHLPTNSHTVGVVGWYDLLAVHEGRHIIQFEELNQGFTKIAGILFGDLGRLASSFRAMPVWFIEGDAVAAETELTPGGRGRSPAFDMDIRTLLLSGIRYSYPKAFLGSYKDWYPNYYHLGYLMVSYLKKNYGSGISRKMFTHTARRSNLLLPFREAVRRETRADTVSELYEKCMDELQAFWMRQQKGLQFTDFYRINTKDRKVWTNYMSPRYGPDGSIYAQKVGLENPMTLVRLSASGKEEEIAQISPLYGFFNRLSVEENRVCWCEAVPDARWGKRVYSVIVVFDLQSGKLRRITKKSNLFDPALSADGNQVAAVEYTPQRRCSLLILDAQTGQEVKRFSNPSNDFYMMPSWSEDGNKIVVVHQNKKRRALSVVDTETGQMHPLISYGFENFTHPVFFEGYVLYNSPYSGIDNIYAIDQRSHDRFQVTSSRLGAFFPEISLDNTKLLYNEYSADGYDVAEITLCPSAWRKIESVEQQKLPYFQPAVDRDLMGTILKDRSGPEVKHEVRKYRPLAHLLNVHSWTFLPLPTDLGFYLFSNDKLNTAALVGGIKYNLNERVLGFDVSGIYSGLYPILDIDFGYGGRSARYELDDGKVVTHSWREASLNLGFRIPLNLSRGIYRTSLSLSSSFSLIKVSDKDYVEPFENGNGVLLPFNHELRFSRIRKPAYRDIKPRWGQSLTFFYRHTPWESDYRGSLFAASLGLYWPGLSKHHSVYIQGTCEHQNPENYHFPSRILFPRGYDYVYHDSFYKVSVEYAFPLAYPDFALDGVIYIKRLRANVFYDHGIGLSNGAAKSFQSGGLELMTDFHVLNIPVELELGIRFAYRWRDKKWRAELVLFDIFFNGF